MPETTIWRGSPSQWKNANHFLGDGVLALVILAAAFLFGHYGSFGAWLLILIAIPLFLALKTYLATKNTVYELTTERLKTSDGILNKVTETLELYRVKDIETRQPFFLRLVGLENIHLQTSDASSPLVIVSAVPRAVTFADKIRNQVEAIRGQKGVREIDME